MQYRYSALAAIGILALSVAPAASATAATDVQFCAIDITSSSVPICAATEADLSALWTSSRTSRATQFLIARLYDNQNYNTAAGYYDIYAAGDCTVSGTGVDYQISDLGTWRDRVSSFKSFGNCATRLWSSTSFSGTAYPSSTTWLASSTYVGATFNDKARSAQFS